jgi:hypothetical protein
MRLSKKLLQICIFLILFSGCSNFLKLTAISKASVKTLKIYSDFNLLPINATWLEAQLFLGKWVRFLPCEYERKSATFKIIEKKNDLQLVLDNGVKVQRFKIKELKYRNKAFSIITDLSLEPSEKFIFQLKKSKKNIFELKFDNKSYFFIANKDLVQFLQISETCAE